MDTLLLHGIKITAILGVYDWERIHPQNLLLDLDITLPPTRAFHSDAIDDTIDYAHLVSALREHCAGLQCKLLEALSEEIATFILQTFAVPQVKIRLIKPGILPNVAEVGVEITRSMA
ncbi:MAG: dihydroneopterin aldolase [Neisseria sp.]|nr:dihydroneopterin aldolase [Neisseria sp.]